MPRGKQSSIRRALSQNLVDIAHTFGVLEAVGEVITDDTSAAGVEVGFANVVRVEVGVADTYIAFGDENIDTVSVSTTPALKLLAGTITHILATDDFIRSSSAFVRMEVIDS